MALKGFVNGVADAGGMNRVGDAANGTPKYLLTAVADAPPDTEVAVPITTPASTVARGALLG